MRCRRDLPGCLGRNNGLLVDVGDCNVHGTVAGAGKTLIAEHFRIAVFQQENQQRVGEFTDHHDLAGDVHWLQGAVISAPYGFILEHLRDVIAGGLECLCIRLIVFQPLIMHAAMTARGSTGEVDAAGAFELGDDGVFFTSGMSDGAHGNNSTPFCSTVHSR